MQIFCAKRTAVNLKIVVLGRAYKVSRGLIQKFGPERVIDTPITEAGKAADMRVSVSFHESDRILCRIHWHCCGRDHGGAETDCRIHDLQFLHASHRPRHQQRCEDPLHVSWRYPLPDGLPWTQRSGCRCRSAALPVLRVLVRALPRLEGAPSSEKWVYPLACSVVTFTWWTQVVSPYDSEDCRGLLKAAIRDPDPVFTPSAACPSPTSLPMARKGAHNHSIPFIPRAYPPPARSSNILPRSLELARS